MEYIDSLFFSAEITSHIMEKQTEKGDSEMEEKTSKVVLNNLGTLSFVVVAAFSAGLGWAVGTKTGQNVLKIRRKKKVEKIKES